MNHANEVKAKAMLLMATVDALSFRERLLILISTLVLAVGLWHSLLMQPLAKHATSTSAELIEIERRISVANRSLEEQILQIAGGSDVQRTRIASLRDRIDEINATLGEHASELISPSEMAQVLEGVLREQSKLTLVQISNTTPEFLSTSDDENAVTFYRHGLEIEFEGSYLACLEYLSAIELLQWKLYWQVLELDVIDYPQNRMRIEVSTLSLDQEWIGA